LKKRIDVLLAENGLCESREKAKAVIMSGNVFADGERIDKPGEQVDENVSIEIREELRYVSRGGLKLEKAMELYDIKLDNKVCADIGASTGGFTDCMLQNGATKVYSVDVGYGQLAWKLRTDERVINMERTNARYLDEKSLNDRVDFFSVDVSFISLSLILPAVGRITSANAEGVCLIKPQFEAGRDQVGKNGVVREQSTHISVVENAFGYAVQNGFTPIGLTYSPIKGPKGNIEYLMYIKKGADELSFDVGNVVSHAHSELKEQ